jgi:hypothetical protein
MAMLEDLEIIKDMLPLIIPLVILQLALMLVAIIDLANREYVSGNNKILWLVVILVINIFGPVIYLLFGRKDNPDGGH